MVSDVEESFMRKGLTSRISAGIGTIQDIAYEAKKAEIRKEAAAYAIEAVKAFAEEAISAGVTEADIEDILNDR